MKVIVYNDRDLNVIEEYSTQNENDFEVMEFKFSSLFDNYNKKIVFLTPDGNISYYINNNKFFIPREITQYEQVKFYIWCTFEDKDFRTKLKILSFYKNENVNIDILPLEKAQIEQIINELEKNILIVQNLEKQTTNLIDEIETKLKNGDFKGDKGDKGAPGESYNDTEIKEEITDIKEEQLTQNTDIETLQTQVADLEEQVQELENNQLTGTATGQSIYIEDSTNTKVRSIGLSGNSEQESTNGYQLLNVKDGTYSNNGITAVGKDGEIVLNGTATATAVIGFPFAYTFNTSTNYTISANNPQTEVNQYDVMLRFDNNVKPFNLNTINKVSTISFTEETTVANLTIRIASGVTLTNFKLKPMIEIGSTAHPWEPYTGGQASPNPSYPQEIHSTGDNGSVNEKVQNKNLFDIDKILLPDGTYTKTGDEIRISNGVRDFYAIDFKENTSYTISYDIKTTGSGNGRLEFYYTDGTTEDCGTNNTTTYMYKSKTSNSNKTLQKIRTTYGDGGSFYLKNIQLEQGSTATDYIAHEEQNISFPLAQGQKLMQGDYLADDGVHHVRGEIVLDGVTDGLKFTTAEPNRNNRFILNLSDIKQRTYTENSYMKSSHFSYNTTVYFDSQDQVGFCANNLGLFVRFGSNSETNTITKANNWLAEHLPKFQYQLAEEVIDPYTEEQQAVWEQIKALRTYKSVTHITSTDEVPATVDVTYVKDLETVINNLGGA